jgi:hypothetical protein
MMHTPPVPNQGDFPLARGACFPDYQIGPFVDNLAVVLLTCNVRFAAGLRGCGYREWQRLTRKS